MESQPWVLTHQLQPERLKLLSNLLVKVRSEVIERHEPEIGDTRLSLGMRAYECCRTRIIQKVAENEWPWLSILNPTGRFTFAIAGVPVRFSRNDPNSLPERKLVPSEQAQFQMRLFEDESRYSQVRWFFVIDTQFDVAVEHAYVVGYSELNSIVSKWEVPLSDTVPTLGMVSSAEPQAVDVKPAKAKLKLVSKKKLNENDKKDE